jgi:hypothetical protein
MQPHQQRVAEEKTELDAKVKALRDFIQSNPIYGNLPQEEKTRLLEQYNIMCDYSDVLGSRISAFE